MPRKKRTPSPARPLRARLRRTVRRALLGALGAAVLLLLAYRLVPVPTTPYQLSEAWRLGGIAQEWVPLERVSPIMARAAVAAEDASFCTHWGFDIAAIRAAIDSGARRGGSTITQQTVKNAFLWQGRSWPRKALEALLTPVIELTWPKRRILEIYLNVIEFGDGIFGVQAAAHAYFDVDAADLSPVQAARLAAILPNPKERSPTAPSDFTRRRAAAILDGAATIDRDGRAACFQN